MRFLCAFLGPKTLFFRARVLCQNNPFFGSVFCRKSWGGRGGGEEFWDALLLRGGLNLGQKDPKEESQEGGGGIRLGRNMQLGSLLVTIVGHLSSR